MNKPGYNVNLKPTGSEERKPYGETYLPYTTPYTGVGQVVSYQKPMAASGFMGHAYSNTPVGPNYMVTNGGMGYPSTNGIDENGKPVVIAYNNSVAKLNQLIAHMEKPKIAIPRLPGAYDMSELSTIDRLVRRYRGMKDLPVHKDMSIEQQIALYPEVQTLSDDDIKEHIGALEKRKENDVLVFKAWEQDAIRVNNSFEYLGSCWANACARVDSIDIQQRFDMGSKAHHELIVKLIALEVQLLDWMKEQPAYTTMVAGMRPELDDPKDDEVVSNGGSYQSDGDAPTLETWWARNNDTSGRLIKTPDGSMSFSPSYMQMMNEKIRRIRENEQAREADSVTTVTLGATREDTDETKILLAPAPSLASSVAGDPTEEDDVEENKGKDRPYIIQELGGSRAKDMAVTRPYEPERDEELVMLSLPEAPSDDKDESESDSDDDDDYILI